MQKHITCFLVDDDIDDIEIFNIALQELDDDIEFFSANNGTEALKMLDKNPTFIPDFIFLDLNMPLMSGKQCLTEIKKVQRLKDVPVVIYSTSSSERDIEETKRLGAAHFLTKPSSITALSESLIRLFKSKE